MSTKATIKLVQDHTGAEWHLHSEVFDNWGVYLTFPKDALEGDTTGELRLCIPLEVWKEIREGILGYEKYLDMSPEELRKEAEEWVQERLERYNSESNPRVKTVIGMAGCMVADITDPVEKQVEDYIEWHTPETKT